MGKQMKLKMESEKYSDKAKEADLEKKAQDAEVAGATKEQKKENAAVKKAEKEEKKEEKEEKKADEKAKAADKKAEDLEKAADKDDKDAEKAESAADKALNAIKAGKKPTKKHISDTLSEFRASKAKVVAMRAEVLTLRARKAEMQKSSIKAGLKGKGGGDGGEERLRESLETTDAGLAKAKAVRDYLKDDLNGPGATADLGESSEVEEPGFAERFAEVSRTLKLREREYEEARRDLARRAREMESMLAR